MWDVFREVSGQSLERATLALSHLTGTRILPAGHAIHFLSPSELFQLLGDGEELVAGISISILKRMVGRILIILPEESVLALLDLLTGRHGPLPALAEEERSAILEVGNILASSSLSTFGDRLGCAFIPSPPELLLGKAAEVLAALLERAALPERALVVEARFRGDQGEVRGRFFLVGDPALARG
ncbi:MAG: chemotaxis protein CheC [Candidatus Methylomirabilales bacterium]